MAEYYDHYDDYDDHYPYPNASTSPEPLYPDSDGFHYDHWHHLHPADHYTYTDDPQLGYEYADDGDDPYAFAEVYADGSAGYTADADEVADVADYDAQHIPYGVDHDMYNSDHPPYEDDGTMTLEYGQPGYWEEYHRRRDEILYGTPPTPHLPDVYFSHEGLPEPAEERVCGEEATWEAEEELQYAEACAYSAAAHVKAEELALEPDAEPAPVPSIEDLEAAYVRGELQEHEVDAWLEVIKEMREIEEEERRIAAEGYFWDEETGDYVQSFEPELEPAPMPSSPPPSPIPAVLSQPIPHHMRSSRPTHTHRDLYPSHFPRSRLPPKPPHYRPLPYVLRGPLARRGHHYQPRSPRPPPRRPSPTTRHDNAPHIKNPRALAITSEIRAPPSLSTRDADATSSASVPTPPAFVDGSRCSPDTAVIDPANVPLPPSPPPVFAALVQAQIDPSGVPKPPKIAATIARSGPTRAVAANRKNALRRLAKKGKG
jgi:hypothetical protein